MSEYIKCQVCNNIIPKESIVCPFCGNKIENILQNIEIQNKIINENENLNQNQIGNQIETQTKQNNQLLINQKQFSKTPDFFNISIELIKNNFSTFLSFSFISNFLITLLIVIINLLLILLIAGVSINKITDFDFSNLNIYLIILGSSYLIFLLLLGLTINYAYLNDITYNTSKKLLEIKNLIKNNLSFDYKIYKNFSLFDSLKNGIIILWYQFLFFIIPIIILIIFYFIAQSISSIIIFTPLCYFEFIFYLIINFLISLIYSYLYLSFFIYLSYININNQKFNLLESYKFIYNNLILKNFANSFISISIYTLFSQFLLPLIYIFFIIFTLGIGLFFLNFPLFIFNTFIFSYLILNIECTN
jgi:hypothetical protein